ncbi:MAG: phospho-N-acetylmuramoyl-pentapeptide-transferase [Patescibacteria group bacterium]|nr:phospho-N-acetylmuramoyl-pentapeptide-transferase [Patescibacteria group bacterium]
MDLSLIKLFLPVILTFILGILITPGLTNIFYKYKLWKKVARKENKVDENVSLNKFGVRPGDISLEFQKINNSHEELKTPRVGGIVIWLSIALCAGILFLLAELFPNVATQKINFVSKNQTLLPFIALILGALWGLADDLMCSFIVKGKFSYGFPRKIMFSFIALVGFAFGFWFFSKLGISSIQIPLVHTTIELGWFFIPFFILVTLGVFSSGVIDGIDGLAGGVMATVFASYATIAFFQNQIDIAAFSAVVAGAILAFLWFNIPPARFYMGETGILALTLTLTVIAFLTDQVLLLPIIGFPLFFTSLSSFLQIVSKKLYGPSGRIFRVAPVHHHFEAIGWSRAKITMRYWIISVVFAISGIVIALL